MLKEFGGGLELTENWTQSVLKTTNWTKRKGTTGKIEPSKKVLEEKKLLYKEKFPLSYRIIIYGQSLFLILIRHAFRMSPRESTLFH